MPAGALVHRVGERRALMWASAVDAVGAFVALTAPSLAVLMATVFAMGFTASVFLVARQAYLIDAVPTAMRARALSTLGGVHRIGLFIGPFVGAPIVHVWGPRAGFAVAVAAGLGAAALVQFGARPDRRARGAGQADAATARRSAPPACCGTTAAPTSPSAWASWSSARPGPPASCWCRCGPSTSGSPPARPPIIFGIAGGVEMLLFYPAGSVMDRFGRVWVAVPCVVLLGLGMLALPLTHSALAVDRWSRSSAAIGNGIGSGIVMTLGADSRPGVGRSQFLGGWRFVSVVGGSGSPALISPDHRAGRPGRRLRRARRPGAASGPAGSATGCRASTRCGALPGHGR